MLLGMPWIQVTFPDPKSSHYRVATYGSNAGHLPNPNCRFESFDTGICRVLDIGVYYAFGAFASALVAFGPRLQSRTQRVGIY